MAIVPVLITLALLGFLVYLVCLIPMPDPVRKIIIGVVIVIVVLFVLQIFGVQTGVPQIRIFN